MTIIEKEKDISKYIKEWTDARFRDWDEFKRYVVETRWTGIYLLKNGNEILDLLNNIIESIGYHLICEKGESIIPEKYSSLDEVIGALNNFSIYIKSKFNLLEPYLLGDDIDDDVVKIASMCYQIEQMVKRCNDVYVKSDYIPEPYIRAKVYLNECKIEKFIEILKSIIGSIPYNMHRQKMSESYFHTTVHVITSVLGFSIVSEKAIVKGRIDMIIQCSNYIYIFEFKYDEHGKDLSEEAISQIKENNYHSSEIINGKKIIGVGVSFGENEKNINGYKYEVLYEPDVNFLAI